jgi:flagellum-specific peptidoglycan hydrolase FlgJ
MEKLPIGSTVTWDITPKATFDGWWLVVIGSGLLVLLAAFWPSATPPDQVEAIAIAAIPEQKHLVAPDEVVNYVKRFQSVAIAEHEKFGIPASVKMAQGILESASGTSSLTRASNNHFGIKCHYRGCKHRNCVNKCDDSCRDYFVKYETAWLSWRAHSLLLSNPDFRYASLISSCGDDYKCWAAGLQKKGYATSKQYQKKLVNIIEKYELNHLDKGNKFQ